jgi:1,4-alpha-glucan branching enzyme
MLVCLILKLIKSQDGWNRDANPMTRGDYGVWELLLPAKDGQPAIPHNSKIKVRVLILSAVANLVDQGA